MAVYLPKVDKVINDFKAYKDTSDMKKGDKSPPKEAKADNMAGGDM